VEGAVRQYHKAIESRPDYYQAHNNLANILIAQGKADEAIEHYRLALEIKPDYTTARQNLDRLLRSKGRSD
jgi:tetratricopeptide (TPR) repeat protein